MPKNLLAIAALVLGFATAAHAADPVKLNILSFTGQIQIKIGNEVIGVVPGGKMPDIPAGAEIIIVSGEAVLQSGNTTIKADGGDSFSFNAGKGGGVQIAATGDKTAITVSIGGTEASLQKGDKVEVVGKGTGGGELKVLAGSVEVTSGGKTETVAAGKSVEAAPTQTAAAPTTTEPTSTEPASTETTTTETSSTESSDTTTTSNEPPPPPPPSPLAEQEIAPVSGSAP